jgi:hypothetical protein
MSKDEPGNQTPGTPDLSETELREKKVDELRDLAKEKGVGASSSLKKEELVDAISEAHPGGGSAGSGGGDDASGDPGPGEGEAGLPGDAGPDGGRLRTGDETSKSLKYSQEIASPDDDPERAGRSLATTNHEVIRRWAEERDAVPATVEGTEHDGRAGVLRFDFNTEPGEEEGRLKHISWDEWFGVFDERKLNFLYQEERKDGNQSNFFRLESPDREDA